VRVEASKYEADHTIDGLVTAVTSAAIVPRLAGAAAQIRI